MKVKISVFVFIITIINTLYSTQLFNSSIDKNDLILTKQEQYKLNHYLKDKAYRNISLVNSPIIDNLLTVNELTYSDNDGKDYIFMRTEIAKKIEYSLWYGQCGENDITLILDKDKITGTINLNNKVYQISHLSNETHIRGPVKHFV